MAHLLFEELTYAILGAAMTVHAQLGPGFLEAIYQRAVRLELQKRRMSFECQKRVALSYNGVSIGEHVLDLVVDERVVVELKAVKDLMDQHEAQVISYLRASGLPLGLLINFSRPRLQHRRFILTSVSSVQSV